MSHSRILLLFIFFGIFLGFSNGENIYRMRQVSNLETNPKDSAEFVLLVKRLLKWHESSHNMDFEVIKINPNDTVYGGINWPAHRERMLELSRTNLFAKEFIDNYNRIALFIDKELRENKTKYQIGDMQPYSDDLNDWCKCQDYPEGYLKFIKIIKVKEFGGSAEFSWTWGSDFNYQMKVQKVNGSWKISYLERFDIKNYKW